MIRGILVKPEQQPQVIEFSNGYRELQKLVEGIFEMPSIFPDVDVVINEESSTVPCPTGICSITGSW